MSDDSTRPIVIKRKKVMAGAHHGGAWKIAYADFVTAMMAFFLLMWLLGSTAKGDLNGIAEFFQNPMKVSATGGSGSGDASTIIPGGGRDLTRTAGQQQRGDQEKRRKSTSTLDEEARKQFEAKEKAMLGELKQRIEKMIESNPVLKQFKSQLLLDITSEGLRIQIVDEQNRPMFDLSSAELKPHTKEILHEIGRALNSVSNRITVSGHTDAAQFAGGQKGFSNWELSANRANASRREMILGGMDENKILRVLGMSSTVLFDKNDPLNPVNRRISIVVLNKKTEEAFLGEEGAGAAQNSDDKGDALAAETKDAARP